MAKATPAFQFYPDDFLGGTQHFTTSEVGGYIRLLCHQWKHGSIPGDNIDRIATIMGMSRAGAKSAWQVIAEKFKKDSDGLWRNVKLEKVRAGRAKFAQEQSEKGVKGAAARWQKDGPVDGHGYSETQPEPSQENGFPNLSSLDQSNASKNDALLAERPPGDLLAVHQRLFVEKYGLKPSYDGPKDAAIARKLMKKHGFDGACALLGAYFASTDAWIAKSGHGMGPLGSATTVNKLLAELSGRAPRNDGRDWAREFVNG